MNKIITLFVCGMAALIILLVAVRWITWKTQKKHAGSMDLPLAVWMGSIAAAGAVIMYRVLLAAGQAVDIWAKLKPGEALKNVATTCCLMIGVGACWLLLLTAITAGFVAVLMVAGNAKNTQAEVDDLAYAAVKGILLLAAVLVLLPVIDGVLALCLPAFNLTYFH
jgi:hypothetical protein